jgi:hypothetical protein
MRRELLLLELVVTHWKGVKGSAAEEIRGVARSMTKLPVMACSARGKTREHSRSRRCKGCVQHLL